MPLVGYKAAGGGIDPRTNYLEDDWGDNALSSRSNADSGAWFYQPVPNQPGDTLVGRYRPEWVTQSGSPSATSGTLTLSDGSSTEQRISTDTRVSHGSWKMDVVTSSTTTGAIQLWYMTDGTSSNLVYLDIQDGGGYDLKKGDGGTFTTLISSTFTEGATLTTETTRDGSDTYELFKDGTSQGTATDSFTPVLVNLHVRNTTDASIDFDNLQVQ